MPVRVSATTAQSQSRPSIHSNEGSFMGERGRLDIHAAGVLFAVCAFHDGRQLPLGKKELGIDLK